jgi:hypothetical protein
MPYELGYADNGGLFIGGKNGDIIKIIPDKIASASKADKAD